jgi:hypothetical protein
MAAEKLPENHEETLTNAFLREASVIRDHGISDALRINTDQTRPNLYTSKVRSERGTRQEYIRFRQLAMRSAGEASIYPNPVFAALFSTQNSLSEFVPINSEFDASTHDLQK